MSEATVSRVLNGKAGVSAATRQGVLAALDILGYERPVRLRHRSAGLVGLITPELNNPIFPAFAQVIEQVLSRYGYTPVLCTQSPGGSTEDELVELLVDRGVTGIVFVSGLHADATADLSRYTRLAGLGVPFVLINGYTKELSAPFISPDDRTSMQTAVRHLVELGHRRIGLATGPTRYIPVAKKIEGFVQAMTSTLGLTDEQVRETVATSLFTEAGGRSAAGTLLEKGCTAIVCGSDIMALGAILQARGQGLSVPGQLSVVGYDDSPLIAYTDPPLTTVRQPVEAMGQAAVDALLEEMNGSSEYRGPLIFQTELVVRGSTAAVHASA